MIKKTSLAPVLRMMGMLDSSACPYVAIQLRLGKPPVFYRSSSFGFVQSKEFDPMGVRHFSSLGHLQDCLRASADSVELSADGGGIVCVESVDGAYRNLLHVHTVREASTGVKYHSIGEPVKESLDPAAFAGIDVSPFDLAQQPFLIGGALFLGTQAGMVKWKVPDSIGHITVHPRKSFLHFACGGVSENLSLSENGYWVSQKDGMVGCFASHSMGGSLQQVFDVPGTQVAVLDAARLVQALRSILMLCEDKDRIGVDPKRGVSCWDKFGNEAMFSLGTDLPEWGKFWVTGQTAKLIASALSQSKEKEAFLYSIVPRSGSPAMRAVRGLFEVDFRVVA